MSHISCTVKHLRKCRIERGCTVGIIEYGKGENVHWKKLMVWILINRKKENGIEGRLEERKWNSNKGEWIAAFSKIHVKISFFNLTESVPIF